jgi:hypothetical protein
MLALARFTTWRLDGLVSVLLLLFKVSDLALEEPRLDLRLYRVANRGLWDRLLIRRGLLTRLLGNLLWHCHHCLAHCLEMIQ